MVDETVRGMSLGNWSCPDAQRWLVRPPLSATRQRIARSGVSLGTIGAAVMLTACGALTADIGGINGNAGARDTGSMRVKVSQLAAYSGYLANKSGHTVTLESASILPLSTFRSPRLGNHIAVETGPAIGGALSGWPHGPAARPYGLKPFNGYRVASGAQIRILYSVAADRTGLYASDGLTVIVKVDGSRQTIAVRGGEATCVTARGHDNCPDWFLNRVYRAVDNQS